MTSKDLELAQAQSPRADGMSRSGSQEALDSILNGRNDANSDREASAGLAVHHLRVSTIAPASCADLFLPLPRLGPGPQY